MWWVQPSSIRSCSTSRPIITALKFSMRSRCQPGCSWERNSSSVGALPRTPIAEGVRWNTYTCSAECASGMIVWIALAPEPTTPTVLPVPP